MNKTIIIAVGGTGGHLYPALAVADDLKSADQGLSILFVGGGLSRNPYFDLTLPFQDISCGSLSMGRPLTSTINSGRIIRGMCQSVSYFRDCKPLLILGFGSYYTLPVLLGARWATIPYILHEQNTIPGRVNRLFSKKALFTGVYFPEAKTELWGNAVEVDMPLRPLSFLSKEQAKQGYGLDPGEPTVLVFGGSQGAQAINHLFFEGVAERDASTLQLLHFTGDAAATEALQQRYRFCGVRSVVKEYEADMPQAWRAADIVVSRAGAGTVAEHVAYEVPGIFIPYPHSMDNHQEKNADVAVHTIGGGIKLAEKGLTSRRLFQEIYRLLEGREEKREAIKKYRKLKANIPKFSSKILDILK